MSGSQQFLGRQLADQAEAMGTLTTQMGTLIEKMEEMVIAQGNAGTIYVEPSDTVKYQEIYPNAEYGYSLGRDLVSYPMGTYEMNITGYINVTLTVYNKDTNTKTLKIDKNASTVIDDDYLGTQTKTNTHEIYVEVGDILTFNTGTASAGDIYLKEFALKYDRGAKQEIII